MGANTGATKGESHSLNLIPEFRFSYHGATELKSVQSSTDRTEPVEGFASRLYFSDGVGFLITGCRGIDKITFVNLAITSLENKRVDYCPNKKPPASVCLS